MASIDDLLNYLDGGEGGGAADAAPTDYFAGTGLRDRKKKRSGLLGHVENVLDNSVLQGAFNVLDTPRRAVTGTATTLGRSVGALALGHDYGDQGPSLRNYWDMVYHPSKGVGLHDALVGNPDKGFYQGAFGNQGGDGVFTDKSLDPRVAVVAGIGGDIATDPLTFLAPVGEVASGEKLAQQVARSGGDIGAEMLARKATGEALLGSGRLPQGVADRVALGVDDVDVQLGKMQQRQAMAVQQARRGGASAVASDLAKEFGVEKGVGMDFGRFGKLRVTSGEGALSNLSVMRHRFQMGLGDALLSKGGEARRFGRLRADAETFAKARSATDPMEMLHATVAKNLRTTARQMEGAFGDRAAKLTNEAVKDATDEQINDARALINGAVKPTEVTEQVKVLAGRMSDAFRAHGQMLVDQGVMPESALMKQGTYFPSPIDPTAREALQLSGLHDAADVQSGGARSYFENARKLWDSSTGKGGIGTGENRVPITAANREEAEVKAAKIVADKLEEAANGGSEAAQEFLANNPEILSGLRDGTYPLFQDGRRALTSQAKAIGRRVAQARAGRELYGRGYGILDPRATKGFTDYGPTFDEIYDLETKGRNAAEKAADLKAMAAERSGDAEQLAAEGAGDTVPTELETQLQQSLSPEAPPAEAPPAPPAAAGPTGPRFNFDEFMAQGGGEGVPDLVGQVEGRRAAKVATITNALPPPAEGTVRLYNHGGTNWWTDDLGYVAQRGEVADVRYLDVTQDEAAALERANLADPGEKGLSIDERLNPELTDVLNRAQNVPVADRAASREEARLHNINPDHEDASALVPDEAIEPPEASGVSVADQVSQINESRAAQGLPPVNEAGRVEGLAPEQLVRDGNLAKGPRQWDQADVGTKVYADGRGAKIVDVQRTPSGTQVVVEFNDGTQLGVMGDEVRPIKAPHARVKAMDARIQQGIDSVNADVDAARQVLADRAERMARPNAKDWDSEEARAAYATQVRKAAAKLEIDVSPRRPINDVVKDLKAAISRSEKEGDKYAAEVRVAEHGRMAEEAQKARAGAEIDPENVGQEVAAPRRKFTPEERQAHGDARRFLQRAGKIKGGLLRDLRLAKAEVARWTGADLPAATDLTRSQNRLAKLEAERAELTRGLENKHNLDVGDAADRTARIREESPTGSIENGDLRSMDAARATGQPDFALEDVNAAFTDEMILMEGGGYHTPEPSDAMHWVQQNAQEYGLTPEDVTYDPTLDEFVRVTKGEQPTIAFEDRKVTRELNARLDQLNERISQLTERLSNRVTPREPVTELELAQQKVVKAQAALDAHEQAMKDALANLPKKGASKYYDAADGSTRHLPIEGSPLEKATNSYAETLDRLNAAPVEPHLVDRERFAHGQRPMIDRDTNDFILHGQIGASHENVLDSRQIKARAEIIRAQWKELGQTQADHEYMRDAFAQFKEQIDKKMPVKEGTAEATKRDAIAMVDTQTDQVGNMAAQPLHVETTVQSVVDQVEAVKDAGAAGKVPQAFVDNAERLGNNARVWQSVLHQAEKVGDQSLAEVARMRITASKLSLSSDEQLANSKVWFERFTKLSTDRQMREAVGSQMVQGAVEWSSYRALQPGMLAPRELADMVTKTNEIFAPGESKFWDAWEKSLHWMRVWQITSPGFHIRNLFGGIFNNALAGVDVETYPKFASLWRKAAAGKDLTQEEARLWTQITSIQSPGQIGSEAVGSPMGRLAGEAKMSMNPFGTKGPITRVSEMAGNNVEFYLRGSLGYDVLAKGGTLDDAAEAIAKFHFDYGDLSKFEQVTKRRVIPFLTWTRHNLPLQAQMLLESPRTYAHWNSVRRNINEASEQDAVVPAYFADIGAMRLPFKQGGGHTYYVPDLPLKDLNILTSPIDALRNGEGDTGSRFVQAFSEPISQMTPLISGPVEWMLGKQIYKGLPLRDDRAIALSDLHIPDWATAPLLLTPLVKKVNGRNAMTERDFYILDKMMPILGRYRRLGGSNEKKQRDKLMSRLISFFAGTQVRTNNLEDQKIANYLSSLETKRQKSLGYSLGAQRPSRSGGGSGFSGSY